MRHDPSGLSGGRGLNFLIFFFTSKFHETSVTRSRIWGKLLMGSTTTGLPSGSSFIRVIHMSLGIPLISAEQDPHFPALQFHLTLRSFACSAWFLWMASRPTMPSEISVVYFSTPPSL